MKTKNFREFRCSQCNRLQFKYLIEKDVIEIEVKCNSCNTFSRFQINLTPIFNILKKLEQIKRWQK